MAEQAKSTSPGATDRATALAAVQALRAKPPLKAGLVETFTNTLTAQGGTVQKITSIDEVPAYIRNTILKGDASEAQVAMGENPELSSLPWTENGNFQIVTFEAVKHGGISVATAELGVAESGSLVLLSGTENPTPNNFLPDHHVVVVKESEIVGHQEEMWEILRKRCPDGLPRAVNLVSGPSSTGDVNVTFVFGAHGPINLHALILSSGTA